MLNYCKVTLALVDTCVYMVTEVTRFLTYYALMSVFCKIAKLKSVTHNLQDSTVSDEFSTSG